MKAIEQHFPVVLFIMLYEVVLTFEPVDEILQRDHSNFSFPVVKVFVVVCKMKFRICSRGSKGEIKEVYKGIPAIGKTRGDNHSMIPRPMKQI